jgi:uncharacterized protein (DUF849 family)
VIITCTVIGSIHTPSMSPALPVTAEEIADAAIGGAEAGAAIVHLHARNPETGQPDQTAEAFEPFLKVIKQRSSCVVNLTTGGAPWLCVEERVAPAAAFKPEVASLNMGSMNSCLFLMLDRFKEFAHDWERQGVLAESNTQQVGFARQIIEGLGLELATPDEAREILALKDGDQVAF